MPATGSVPVPSNLTPCLRSNDEAIWLCAEEAIWELDVLYKPMFLLTCYLGRPPSFSSDEEARRDHRFARLYIKQFCRY